MCVCVVVVVVVYFFSLSLSLYSPCWKKKISRFEISTDDSYTRLV